MLACHAIPVPGIDGCEEYATNDGLTFTCVTCNASKLLKNNDSSECRDPPMDAGDAGHIPGCTEYKDVSGTFFCVTCAA